MEIFLVILVVAALIGIYLWVTYNALVALKVRVDEAWSDITIQLKRRADLIPNLIETVRGYASHEKEVFENVTRARAATVSPESLEHPAQAAAAEGMLQGALKSLFAVSEAYPQLVANQNFLELQRELTDTEDKVMAARRFFNGGVRELNTKIEQFPNNVFAKNLGFTQREFFEVEDRASIEEPPQVKF
jgi:LemA protein